MPNADKLVAEVLEELVEDVIEKAAAFDRFVDAVEEDGDLVEAAMWKQSVLIADPGERAIRKAAAMDRIWDELLEDD